MTKSCPGSQVGAQSLNDMSAKTYEIFYSNLFEP